MDSPGTVLGFVPSTKKVAGGVIGLHADAIWLASNAYMVCLHVPDCHIRTWNVVYTARDSPGQPRAIVVVHQKQLKFERGHRATRQCDITYIQRIYDTYKYHGTHIGNFGRFSTFYSLGHVELSAVNGKISR